MSPRKRNRACVPSTRRCPGRGRGGDLLFLAERESAPPCPVRKQGGGRAIVASKRNILEVKEEPSKRLPLRTVLEGHICEPVSGVRRHVCSTPRAVPQTRVGSRPPATTSWQNVAQNLIIKSLALRVQVVGPPPVPVDHPTPTSRRPARRMIPPSENRVMALRPRTRCQSSGLSPLWVRFLLAPRPWACGY